MAAVFNLCKKLINKYKASGDESALADLEYKIDVYYAADRLTEAEYRELRGMIGLE